MSSSRGTGLSLRMPPPATAICQFMSRIPGATGSPSMRLALRGLSSAADFYETTFLSHLSKILFVWVMASISSASTAVKGRLDVASSISAIV